MLYTCQRSGWRKISGSSHWEISISFTIQECKLMLIIQFSSNYVYTVCLWKVKNKRKFKLFTLKVLVAAYEREVVVCSVQEVSNIVIWLENFWYSILENMLLRRGGHLQEVIATRGPTVIKYKFVPYCKLSVRIHFVFLNDCFNDFKMHVRYEKLLWYLWFAKFVDVLDCCTR